MKRHKRSSNWTENGKCTDVTNRRSRVVTVFSLSRIFMDLIMHDYWSNQSALMTRCGTEFRHQCGIFVGESQTSFMRNATRAGNEEGRLFSQATNIASSRRSVSQGAMQKTTREKIKKSRWEEARERLWENLTKGRSGKPGSGIPSDWSILTDFVNTRALLTQMRYSKWKRPETLQWVTRCSNLL